MSRTTSSRELTKYTGQRSFPNRNFPRQIETDRNVVLSDSTISSLCKNSTVWKKWKQPGNLKNVLRTTFWRIRRQLFLWTFGTWVSRCESLFLNLFGTYGIAAFFDLKTKTLSGQGVMLVTWFFVSLTLESVCYIC